MRGARVAYERDPYDMQWNELSNGLVIVNGTQNHCDALKTNLMHPLSLWENHGHYTYIWNQVKAIIHKVKSMVLLYLISHGAFVIPKLEQHGTSTNFVQNNATWWINQINEWSRRWWSSTNSQQQNKPTSWHFMGRIVHDAQFIWQIHSINQAKDPNFLQLNRNSLQSELLSLQSNLKSILHLSKDGVFLNNYKGNQFNKAMKLNRVNQSN